MGQNLVKTASNQEIVKFDYSEQARPFVLKSLSVETRRTYEGHIKEFFHFHGSKHPSNVTATDVIRWRDSLMKKGSRPATVTTKLSIIRSFFEYLRAAGVLDKNPASTKLVPTPELPEGLAGRALTPKEVRYLLSGPDRKTATGARDYALCKISDRLLNFFISFA